ncbi:MAG: hypothetical protein HPY61_13290 [Methanotrichaceae archaeon]|nr:hypothetical protein [Methanotrichaceae archaeon]
MNDRERSEQEKMRIMELEGARQALADFLQVDPKEILPCFTRINDLATFQAQKMLYVMGTEEEVSSGIRGYFEHNLADLDSGFIGERARLESGDAQVVARLCEIMNEDLETEVLNEALLNIITKCGDLKALIDVAVAGVNRAELLSMDGKEKRFGKYLIYRFKEGQCSDLDR